MRYIEVNSVKKELAELLHSIDEFKKEIDDGKGLDLKDIEFYRFIGKQIVLYKKLLIAYPKSFFIKVLISDYYSLIINDIKKENRYYYLNQRSIIENYLRMIDKNEENHSHVTRKTFINVKENNDITEEQYNKLMNEYKIACSYIHGGLIMSNYLVTNFQESINLKPEMSFRTKESQRYQFVDLINILNGLFLDNNADAVASAFHRSRVLLEYLVRPKYIDRLNKLIESLD